MLFTLEKFRRKKINFFLDFLNFFERNKSQNIPYILPINFKKYPIFFVLLFLFFDCFLKFFSEI